MESWERHNTARNHPLFATRPLIEWKWAVDKVVVHHGTAPMLAALHSFELRKGNVPECPYVGIHINTQKKVDEPIKFYDYRNDGFDLQWALGQLSIPKNIRALEVAIRFDITRETLQHYYEEPFVLDAQAAKASAKPPSPMYVDSKNSSTEHSHRGKRI